MTNCVFVNGVWGINLDTSMKLRDNWRQLYDACTKISNEIDELVKETGDDAEAFYDYICKAYGCGDQDPYGSYDFGDEADIAFTALACEYSAACRKYENWIKSQTEEQLRLSGWLLFPTWTDLAKESVGLHRVDVGDRYCSGSATDAGDILLGVGMYGLARFILKYPGLATEMAKTSEMHTWVTAEV